MMARDDDPRPGRRLKRRLAPAIVAAALAVGAGYAVGSRPVSWPPSTVAAPGVSAQPSAASASAPATASPPAPPSPAPSRTPRSEIEPAPAEHRASAIRGPLQAALDAARARMGIPGVSVTIIFGDGTIWTGTSGRSDVDARVAVDAETAFALASISKTYTAAAVLALADEGRIDLDTPARTYLPGAVIDPRITVRQLLDHTSGLDDYFLHPPIDRALLASPATGWSTARTLKYVGKPYFPPGRGWHYSNTNYLYLGLIVERVTGTTLAKALRTRFFDPLGLDSTWYQAAEKPRTVLAHGYRFPSARISTRPIDLSDGSPVAPFTSVVSAAAGAGSIAATSSDVARWARLLYTGSVLGPEMTAEMLGGVAATAGYSPRIPYGLGVQAFWIDGRPTLGHSGRLLGFRSAVRHLPAESLTIAVLTNQSRADPSAIVEELLSIIFAPDAPCVICQQPL
jgi:D-alanyl-D-alanine carboxypeptidase